jgi:LacI family transcriptional regulator, galactose operon repressor
VSTPLAADRLRVADLLRAAGGRRYAVVLAVDAVGGGLLRPVLLLYGVTVLRLGADAAGLALTCGLLAGLATLPLVGRWIDRGARSAVVASTLLIRAGGIGVLLAGDRFVGFMVASTLMGIGSQAYPTAHAAVVATLASGRERDAALAASRSLRNAGLGVGAVIAAIAVAGGGTALRWLAAANAATLVASALLVITMRLTNRMAVAAPTERAAGRLRHLTPLLLANLPYALCFAVLEVALPALVVTRLQVSPAWSAGMFVGNTVLVILSQVAVVVRLARWPREAVLAASGAVLAISYLGFWTASGLDGTTGAGAMALVCIIYTIGEILYTGSSTSLVIATSPPDLLGRALARFQLSTGLGQALAPALLTALLTAGTGHLWLSLAVSTGVAAAWVLRFRQRHTADLAPIRLRCRAPEPDLDTFQPLPTLCEVATTSIKEVAQRAGVSVGTVSNVLNRPDMVAPSTRRRVLDAITELGYVRNDSARQLRAGRSNTIAIVVLDVANPFFTDVVRGVELAADELGVMVVVCNSGEDPARESRHLEQLEQQRVRGVLITPVEDRPGSRLDQLILRGTPVVLVDRGSGLHNRCSVAVDDVLGGRLAGAHLVEQGHRLIAFVGGPPSLQQIADRHRGIAEALVDAPADLLVVSTPSLSVAAGRRAAAEIADRPARTRPTAVFCANDLLALGVLQEMTLRGLRVPKDVAIIGYDDIDFAAAAAVPLSSIRQPREQLGRTAAQLLLEEVEEGTGHQHRHVVFQPELVVRESTDGLIRQPEPSVIGG